MEWERGDKRRKRSGRKGRMRGGAEAGGVRGGGVGRVRQTGGGGGEEVPIGGVNPVEVKKPVFHNSSETPPPSCHTLSLHICLPSIFIANFAAFLFLLFYPYLFIS